MRGFTVVLIFNVSANVKASELRFGLSIFNNTQRIAYYTRVSDFEAFHPGICVSDTAFTSELDKEKFSTFLAADFYYSVF